MDSRELKNKQDGNKEDSSLTYIKEKIWKSWVLYSLPSGHEYARKYSWKNHFLFRSKGFNGKRNKIEIPLITAKKEKQWP